MNVSDCEIEENVANIVKSTMNTNIETPIQTVIKI